MAFQTLHSSSASTPAETGTPSPDNGTSGSPAESPPLILAFLAIGLFSAVMIVVFGWRRIHFAGSGRWGLYAPSSAVVEITDRFGKRPKLWDLWTEPSASKQLASRRFSEVESWENIMPISATRIKEDSRNRKAESTLFPPTASTELRRTDRPNSHFSPRNFPFMHSGRPTLLECRNGVEEEKLSREVSTMQVAVAIALPRRAVSTRPADIHDALHPLSQAVESDDRKGKEYCIGLYHCPWQDEVG
ncbi:hypothetical protein BDQ12DRAFT_739449 [Crucibulum laeve]|uniref:Uncharacterized protein n=1 Tax=Crucibulum laeve TaxID=68775 RepID=A0A5C3LHP7_9AGAR|nr:hypothetical protein BDQ12DRAFT_739449 [Crucibulum laeve]